MHAKFLRCVSCSAQYPKTEFIYRCSRCGGALEIIYDYEEIAGKLSWPILRKRHFNHWRYREFYPLIKDDFIVSLDEGGTHLVRSRSIGKTLGFANLFFKCENLNHTGSFKDRGSTLEISKALEFGASEVVCATTGNMGASVAAYAAAAGMRCKIFLAATSRVKAAQIAAYGAAVRKVRDYTEAQRLAEAYFKKNGRRGAYLAGDYPYRGEGEKSIAYEIADELITDEDVDEGADVVIAPMGNGTLVSALWKGHEDMIATNLVSVAPQLIGVQSAGCAPIVKAFNEGGQIRAVTSKTKAEAIAVGDPLDGIKAVSAIRKSQGSAVAVSDKEIADARNTLAKREGILAEYAGAAALAGFMKVARGLRRGQKIVLLVTGSGFKDLI